MERLRCNMCGGDTRPDKRQCQRCAIKVARIERARREREWTRAGIPLAHGRRCGAWLGGHGPLKGESGRPRCFLSPGHPGTHDCRAIAHAIQGSADGKEAQ